MGLETSFDILVKVYGGGLVGQSEAILSILFRFFFLFSLFKDVLKFKFFVFSMIFVFYILRLAISRALYAFVDVVDQEKLKVNGFLTRNSLCKERRSLSYLFCFNLI